jgi:uncharacterized protein (DUF2384 family)
MQPGVRDPQRVPVSPLPPTNLQDFDDRVVLLPHRPQDQSDGGVIQPARQRQSAAPDAARVQRDVRTFSASMTLITAIGENEMIVIVPDDRERLAHSGAQQVLLGETWGGSMPRRTTEQAAGTRSDATSRGGLATVQSPGGGPGKPAVRAGSTARRGRAAPLTITVSAGAEAGYAAAGPVARVVDALGNNVVADLLGVARSQPSRWRSGRERLSPENRRRISDLDHVLDRLLLELHPDQAGLWLTGANPHLAGARPVDVLELRGAAAVLPAIDALAAGAFA